MVHLLRFAQFAKPTWTYGAQVDCSEVRLPRGASLSHGRSLRVSVEQAFAVREDNELEANAAVAPNLSSRISSRYLRSQAAHLRRRLIDHSSASRVVQPWPPPVGRRMEKRNSGVVP